MDEYRCGAGCFRIQPTNLAKEEKLRIPREPCNPIFDKFIVNMTSAHRFVGIGGIGEQPFVHKSKFIEEGRLHAHFGRAAAASDVKKG